MGTIGALFLWARVHIRGPWPRRETSDSEVVAPPGIAGHWGDAKTVIMYQRLVPLTQE